MAILKIATLNCQGQTGLTPTKALFIENVLRRNKYDILHLQETYITDETFGICEFLERNYNIYKITLIILLEQPAS